MPTESYPVIESESYHLAFPQCRYLKILFPGQKDALTVRETVTVISTDADMKMSRKKEKDAVRTAARFGQQMGFGQ